MWKLENIPERLIGKVLEAYRKKDILYLVDIYKEYNVLPPKLDVKPCCLIHVYLTETERWFKNKSR